LPLLTPLSSRTLEDLKMSDVQIEKGLLKGLSLAQVDQERLREFSHSESQELRRTSFYKGSLNRATFRGVKFLECSFSKSTFDSVIFRKCIFTRVDLTRSEFKNCYFSDCKFVDCDPYYVSFVETVIEPRAFRECYRSGETDLNKALLLFSRLKRNLEEAGDHTGSRSADYYYRRWQRRLLYHRWRFREVSGGMPWLWSLLIGALTGYGERPVYAVLWIFSLITVMGAVYCKFFPFVVAGTANGFLAYWYFSFKIFCAKGFTETVGKGLVAAQVSEFTIGLIFLALLVGSITRKLS
jgi:hypothetical protein